MLGLVPSGSVGAPARARSGGEEQRCQMSCHAPRPSIGRSPLWQAGAMGDEAGSCHVFLCYSWADSEVAAGLHDALTAEGLSVFQDAVEGEIYAPLGESIRDALDRSRTLVVLM